MRPELTLFLRIDNLTDAVYESALGYPGLPRAFVAGGTLQLRRLIVAAEGAESA